MTAHEGANACQQFWGGNRLGEMVVRSGIEHLDTLFNLATCRKHDHSCGSQLAAQFICMTSPSLGLYQSFNKFQY